MTINQDLPDIPEDDVFDFAAAVEERRQIKPFRIEVGSDKFEMETIIDLDKWEGLQLRPLDIIEAQMAPETFQAFTARVRSDPRLVLEQTVLSKILGKFFAHIGTPSIYKPDGSIDREAIRRVGESQASNR